MTVAISNVMHCNAVVAKPIVFLWIILLCPPLTYSGIGYITKLHISMGMVFGLVAEYTSITSKTKQAPNTGNAERKYDQCLKGNKS